MKQYETLISFICGALIATSICVTIVWLAFPLIDSGGAYRGWKEATEQMNIPSSSEIQHMAEVCAI